jgi:hypothetical protein
MKKNDIEVVYTDGMTIDDQDYRKQTGIMGQEFRCSICGKVQSYEKNYAGTYEEEGLKKHFCISCINKLGKLIHVF